MKTQNYMKMACSVVMLAGLSLGATQAQNIKFPHKLEKPIYRRTVLSTVTPVHPIIGDTVKIRIRAAASDSFSLSLYQDTLLVKTIFVTGGTNELIDLGVGQYKYTLSKDSSVVGKGHFNVNTPKVGVHIRPSRATIGDTISVKVTAPTSSNFTLNIYQDTTLVKTVQVTGGTTVLPGLGIGHYKYELVNSDAYIVGRGKFDVVAPVVHSWIISKRSTVGDTIAIKIAAPATETFVLTIYKDSTLVNTLNVIGGLTTLPLLEVGRYSYQLTDGNSYVVSKGRFDVQAPVIHARIVPSHTTVGDTISIKVLAPTMESFTLQVFKDSVAVQTLTITGGTTVLPSFEIGQYNYKLIDEDNYVVSKGHFIVHAPVIHAKISDPISTVGDTLSLYIKAATTASFTLKIYLKEDSVETLAQTLSVNGGTNALPAFETGKYRYELVQEGAIVVAKGKFEVRAVQIKSVVSPNPSIAGEGSINIDAPATETFTLNVYSPRKLEVSLQVQGGDTKLPTLAQGVYYYKVLNANGDLVSQGRILVIN